MENIDIAELLKNCPQGMELNCLMFENVYFDKISDDKKAYYPILCYITDEKGNRSSISFTKNGCESMRYGAKCVIFPKGKTTWEGFVPFCQFKDGDIVTNIEGTVIIYMEITACGYYGSFVSLDNYNQFRPHYKAYLTGSLRIATDKEKQKLFDAIKANGYKWNPQTKTLEKLSKPNFKVGDRIKKKGIDDIYAIEITAVTQTIYTFKNGGFQYVDSTDKDYELVPNK